MESQNSPTAALSGQVLFYNQPEPLNSDIHGKLGLKRSDKPYGFAKSGHVVPLTVTEFGLAAANYPVIFAGDKRQPVAITALNGNESLFIEADGSYAVGAYIPAYVRRFPFVLANDEANQRMIVCIDRASNLFDEPGDVPLFDEKGEPTEYTQNSIKFCDDYELERRRTESFVTLLNDLDLFELKEATFTPANPDGTVGTPQKVAEYFAISETKLNALPVEKFAELRDNGALPQIYAHMMSLANWDRLIAMTLTRQMQAQGNA